MKMNENEVKSKSKLDPNLGINIELLPNPLLQLLPNTLLNLLNSPFKHLIIFPFQTNPHLILLILNRWSLFIISFISFKLNL